MPESEVMIVPFRYVGLTEKGREKGRLGEAALVAACEHAGWTALGGPPQLQVRVHVTSVPHRAVSDWTINSLRAS